MLAVEVWRVPHRGTTDFLLNFKFQMTFQMQMQRYNRFYKLEFEYMIFWATSVWCPLSGASCLGSFQTRSDWTSTVSAEPWLKSYVFFWGEATHPQIFSSGRWMLFIYFWPELCQTIRFFPPNLRYLIVALNLGGYICPFSGPMMPIFQAPPAKGAGKSTMSGMMSGGEW